jgi:hypothetical protein
MVVMSMETYEEQLRRLEFYQELAISEEEFKNLISQNVTTCLQGVLHLTGLKCILP